MEENRLTLRHPKFDESLFNQLYKELRPLRCKLASEVNPKLFNLQYDDILSSFDVKFLFVFNKYCSEYDANRMKATLINSLKTYKFRLLKQSQTLKNSVNTQSSYLDDSPFDLPDLTQEQEDLVHDSLVAIRARLSQEEWEIFMIEVDPPLYIINRLIYRGFDKPIPFDILADYLGLSTREELLKLERLRKRIKKVLRQYRREVLVHHN